MGLFRALLIIVFVFYAFSVIVRLIFKHRINKLQRQMDNFGQEKKPSSNDEARTPHVDPNIGEYTDFEEVE